LKRKGRKKDFVICAVEHRVKKSGKPTGKLSKRAQRAVERGRLELSAKGTAGATRTKGQTGTKDGGNKWIARTEQDEISKRRCAKKEKGTPACDRISEGTKTNVCSERRESHEKFSHIAPFCKPREQPKI